MRAFNRLFKIGTKVLLDSGDGKWHTITEIHETRKWIKVENNYGGSWQRNQIVRFTNKNI